MLESAPLENPEAKGSGSSLCGIPLVPVNEHIHIQSALQGVTVGFKDMAAATMFRSERACRYILYGIWFVGTNEILVLAWDGFNKNTADSSSAEWAPASAGTATNRYIQIT